MNIEVKTFYATLEKAIEPRFRDIHRWIHGNDPKYMPNWFDVKDEIMETLARELIANSLEVTHLLRDHANNHHVKET